MTPGRGRSRRPGQLAGFIKLGQAETRQRPRETWVRLSSAPRRPSEDIHARARERADRGRAFGRGLG
jgi:hypothetical protein